MGTAQARACSNIALVKYWGKRDPRRNLPATGSLSLTVSGLWSATRVTFDPGLREDRTLLDGRAAPREMGVRVSAFLDRVRALSGLRSRARVETRNNFPFRAGLASSASGFAALAAAATRAAGLDLSIQALAELARRGSGSSPRSLLGGFVALRAGTGRAPRLEQVAPPEHWDLRLVIALCAAGPKQVGSTEGMERTRRTSPYFEAWVRTHREDMRRAEAAIRARDLEALGEVTEASCFKMHALALSARPALIYWNPLTLAVIRRVAELRAGGLPAFLTIDAGPHVKVLCRAGEARELARALRRVAGVHGVLVAAPGPGIEVRP